MTINVSTLGILCPMHVCLAPSGHIRVVGATMAKLRPKQSLIGARFLEVFEITRPRGLESVADLLTITGKPMTLRFRDAPHTGFKAVLVPDRHGGVVIDLSFGIWLAEAVQDYDLTSTDFAPTDLSIEMLYLIEAKSNVMDASRSLNRRLQVARIAAEEQAFTDTLTGLKNRRALDHVLMRKMTGEKPFALMHLDLDHFKAVNDTHGHAAGDQILQEAAQRMLSVLRDSDTVGRIGGDEFVLVVDNPNIPEDLSDIAARLISGLERPILYNRVPCRISASIGIATSDGQGGQPEELIAQADAALYAAKRAGRGRYRLFPLAPA